VRHSSFSSVAFEILSRTFSRRALRLRGSALPSVLSGCLLWLAAGCQPSMQLDHEMIQMVVKSMLEQQVRDWNEGQIDRFMRAYAQGDSTRFASGGDVTTGWQAVLDRYRSKYPSRAAMGRLTFTDIEVTPLAADAALAFGKWRLDQPLDKNSGLFTLLFRNTKDGWRIVHDHTSAGRGLDPSREPRMDANGRE
jgi:ketosteroid isomerase-like protein